MKMFEVKERTQPIKEKNRDKSKQNKKITVHIRKLEQQIDRTGEHRWQKIAYSDNTRRCMIQEKPSRRWKGNF